MKMLGVILVAGLGIAWSHPVWAQAQPAAPTPELSPQEQVARALRLPVEITSSTGLKLKLIPPADFLMGSTDASLDTILKIFPAADKSWFRGEQPPHRVRLAVFYLGANEVTQDEFVQVIGRNPSFYAQGGPGENLVQGVDTRRFPVEFLTWFDAVLFCNKLSERERLPLYYAIQGATVVSNRITQAQVKVIGGTGYRLPTEAEWEFACRSGRYESAGMETVHVKADSVTLGGRPSPVGSEAPNDFGLFDMQDNVTEWCQDWYSETYYGTSPRANPVGPLFGDKRALRGGSWLAASWNRRCETRFSRTPDEVDGSVGFRVARNVRR